MKIKIVEKITFFYENGKLHVIKYRLWYLEINLSKKLKQLVINNCVQRQVLSNYNRENLKEAKLKMDISEKLKQIDEEIECIDTEIYILR